LNIRTMASGNDSILRIIREGFNFPTKIPRRATKNGNLQRGVRLANSYLLVIAGYPSFCNLDLTLAVSDSLEKGPT
jgi:hypothetical protein